MSVGRTAAFLLVVVVCLWKPLRGADRSVSCPLRSSCFLPCPFEAGPEVVIHWLHPPDATSSVHSFYHDEDQLGRQLPRYRGRTKLFTERISRGDASLLLSGVELEDRGRYKCYTSTINGNNEDFINVDVQAPVLQVSLEQEAKQLLCRSEQIFPRPAVSWTPSSAEANTTVSESEQGLFSVVSSVSLSDSVNVHSCNVSTGHSWRSATYRRKDGVTWSGSSISLPCVEADEPMKSLVWTFNRTQTILRRTGTNTNYGPGWESRVGPGAGSELVLKELSRDQQGLYSCEILTDQGAYFTVTEVAVGELQSSARAPVIAAIVVTALLLPLLVTGVFLLKRWYGNRKKLEKTSSKPDCLEAEEKLNPPDLLQCDGDQSS